LYALYSKNKPKSDALLASHGHAFFRRKQLELGDKMDLSSYLLKPVQRMSKYALLLADLMKEVGVAQEAELAALLAKMLLHLIRGSSCSSRSPQVNLKEQGQLIRQDEFTVWSGRRKCQRHIFLFQELVLFSKLRKVEGGRSEAAPSPDASLCCQTADIGLTESTGDSGLRFEIWFRRRTSKNQTFIFQAASAEVKRAWTGDIARILWTQAARNKGGSRGGGTVGAYRSLSQEHETSSQPSMSTCTLTPESWSSPSSVSSPVSFILVSAATESSSSSSRCLSGSTGSDSGCVSSHLQEALSAETNPIQPLPSSSNKPHLHYLTPVSSDTATIYL
uniref:Uncharacterized protein n=1 Tax=Oryzias melastigma TaxID=30732 RepID=A0A3B3CU43_ORYME